MAIFTDKHFVLVSQEYLHSTRQVCSKLFQGGVAKVYIYIACIVSRGVWGHAPPRKFVKPDPRRLLLRPFLGPALSARNKYTLSNVSHPSVLKEYISDLS